MYVDNCDFFTDGEKYYIGFNGVRAIDIEEQTLVVMPPNYTLLLGQAKVKEICKALVRNRRLPQLKNIKKGDYVEFNAFGRFEGFVVYHLDEHFDTTGDDWNTSFSFIPHCKGYTLLAHIPGQEVLDHLLKHI